MTNGVIVKLAEGVYFVTDAYDKTIVTFHPGIAGQLGLVVREEPQYEVEHEPVVGLTPPVQQAPAI